MYNDTIDASNKIITSEDLLDIFEKMNEEMLRIQRIANEETARNANLDYLNQKWAYKFFNSSFKCSFNFYDATTITVDTYEAFLNLYNTRLQEIKDMWVRCHINYSNNMSGQMNALSNSISMNIYEYSMNINSNLSSVDNTLDEVYELIKEKILNAPEKYDEIVKKKSNISNKIGFAIGMIPSLIICSLLAIIPLIRLVYGASYILYPILTLLLGYLGGNTLFRGKIDSLYSHIEPNKKYAGYDENYKSIYKDDLNDYTKKSEVLIGKNVNNLNIRKEIMDLNEKYSKFIPIELFILLVLSIVMIFVGKFIQ